MSIELVRRVLLWSSVINYGVLVLWALLFLSARGWMHRIGRWYRLSDEHMDLIQIAGMTFFKLIIIVFNIVPYIALWIAA
jgi:hypothetical protein